MLALWERGTITCSLRTTWDQDRLSLRTLLVGRFLSVKLTPSSPDAGAFSARPLEDGEWQKKHKQSVRPTPRAAQCEGAQIAMAAIYLKSYRAITDNSVLQVACAFVILPQTRPI